MQPHAYAVFHLNLGFSSIPEDARPEVVRRCYRPLLDLVENGGLPLGIELTGWTLERLEEIDPEWVQRLRSLVEAGSCELIGSGYAQIIGPLVPHRVNEWNQRLGIETYRRVLGTRPRIVLVNEMAFSSSLIDLYAAHGYEGVIMDRDNVRLALDIEDDPLTDAPTHGVGPGGASLPILWADSILFQKLQHFAHGDIRRAEYLDYVSSRIDAGERLLPLYANDAEVFDFRPGRFGSESRIHRDGEWKRIEQLWAATTDREDMGWLSPSGALEAVTGQRPATLASAAYPIPVKKQAKYNLGRWAVTGRDDLWINTMCHRLAARLVATESDSPDRWRRLCELWATDLRTHITDERWDQARRRLDDLAGELEVPRDAVRAAEAVGTSALPEVDDVELGVDEEGIMLDIETEHLRLTLNLRRGLTVQSLSFASHDFVPSAGTVPHGYFRSIALGADFYTGGVVVELPAEHRRITDLDWVDPVFGLDADEVRITVDVATPLGPIVKTVAVARDSETVRFEYHFPGWDRPQGTIRVGKITLMPGADDDVLTLECSNGGVSRESFRMDRGFDHAAATSSLISSTAGVGATDGEIIIGAEGRRLSLRWDPTLSAAFPMVTHLPSHPGALTRVLFSLAEMDDTARSGGGVGPFAVTIRSSR